jgi:pyrroloquinoline quinone (PQQ) biosynthesis protein C|tara:strand:+ start:841 stop:1050 length:210 start_codon:yes stop_codon:yes gene_type:complete
MAIVNGITQADVDVLVSENSLAAEQLRRIMAERQRQELQAELDDLKATAESLGISPNGVEKLDQVPAEA